MYKYRNEQGAFEDVPTGRCSVAGDLATDEIVMRKNR